MSHDLSDLRGCSGLIYARKSNDDPKNPGKSTRDQVARAKEEFIRRGIELRQTLVDEGKGASRHSRKAIREGFIELMALLDKDPPDVLSMWELSRATRRLGVFSELLDLCEDKGVLLLLGDRVYDPADHRDRMLLGINAVIDESEVSRTRERTLRGLKAAAEEGLPHGRNIYAYERKYHPRTRALQRVKIVHAEAEIIREVVARVLAGDSSRGIAHDLNERGVPRPADGKWWASEIKDICTRPTYCGKREHNGVIVADAVWPAIIEPDDWEELQRIFRRRSRGGHQTNAKYLLSGLVICDACDKPMYRQAGSGNGKRLHGYHCQFCSRTRNAGYTEAFVTATVNQWLRDPHYVNARRAAQSKEPAIEIAVKRLTELRAELEEVHELLESGDLSPRAVASAEKRLLPEIQDLEDTLIAQTENATNAEKALLAAQTAGIDSLDRLETIEEKRALLAQLIRVRCLPAKRGRGFDLKSLKLVSL